MIRVSNIKVPLEERGLVERAVAAKLGLPLDLLRQCTIHRESIDARDKRKVHFVYIVDVVLDSFRHYPNLGCDNDIAAIPEVQYTEIPSGQNTLQGRPIIVGAGPAGLFAALLLAERGYRPLLLERGDDVDARTAKVAEFWSTGSLDSESNVQFGEGGAGTFSDGKLTTTIRDPRCRRVLLDLVAAGAPPNILFLQKPHVGTDILRGVVKNLRERIVNAGGEVRFRAKVTDIVIDRGAIKGVIVNGESTYLSAALILALGHSARDTLAMLLARGVEMGPKAFAIGARIEHPQSLIDEAQYGAFAGHPNLGPADYKLAHSLPGGRAAYTFCMCPGGAVVAAASEDGRLVTNGMSEQARDRPNANSALLVGVLPSDFGSNHPLAGVDFQRRWEERAFIIGGGDYRAPVQKLNDFLRGRETTALGKVPPSYLPGVSGADLAACLPQFVVENMRAAIRNFDRKLKGFACPDALLTGVETRSSSPVRLVRDTGYESNIKGLYPAGEGAGYAGGIMSAAVDGLRLAESIVAKYRPF